MSRAVRWTEAELASVLHRLGRERGVPQLPVVSTAPAPPRNRHTNARKTLYAGRLYDSKAEAARAATLDVLKAQGAILEVWPQWKLVIEWPGTDQILLRYKADFRVMGADRSIWYEEVKGRRFRDWPVRERILRLAGVDLRVMS